VVNSPEEGLVAATGAAVSRALADGSVSGAQAVVVAIMETKKITTDEQAAALTDSAKICVSAKKALEEQLKSITEPLRRAEKNARAVAAPSIKQFDDAIEYAKELYRGFNDEKKAQALKAQQEQQRLEREAEEKRKAEAAAGAPDDDEPAPSTYVKPTETLVRGVVGGMTMRKEKKYRITNLVDAVTNHPELFRIELKVNDTKALLARKRVAEPEYRLLGIEEYEDETPTMA
jgi:hypothetical protein